MRSIVVEAEVRKSVEDRGQADAELEPREVDAEAEVASPPEGEVRGVAGTIDVPLLAAVVVLLVAVRRPDEHRDDRPRRNRTAADLGVALGHARHHRDGGL